MSESIAKSIASPPRRMGVEVQGRVDEYLLRLDIALTRRGADAVRRREVGVSVRNQILTKLSERAATSARGGIAKPQAGGELHLAAADAEAVLSAMGLPEKIAMEMVVPPPVVARYAGPSSLSLLAVAGLIWALMFPVMILLQGVTVTPVPGESPPWWTYALQFVVLPMGWASLIASPVLGLLALDRIRKSRGKIYGLSLALFDSLLFPLLALDVLVFWLCWQLASQMMDQATIAAPVAKLITQALPTVACVLGDYFLAARAWMAVTEEN